MEITGMPSASDIESVNSPLAATMLEQLPPVKQKKLKTILPTASDEAIDFIKRLLTFNPNKRMTAEQCLEHPFVA